MRLFKVKTFAIAVGAMGSLAAFTAFGVAPLAEPVVPPSQVTVEAVALVPEVLATEAGSLQQEQIRRGDTLSSLLARVGASDPGLVAFVRDDPVARKLLELRAGRSVSAVVSDDGTVERLTYRLTADAPGSLGHRLVIVRDGRDGFSAFEEAVPIERAVETRSVEIRRTLTEALETADIPDTVLTRMADIFGPDVNFQSGLRRGDRFRVVYETHREAGSLEPPIVGRILAVQFGSGSRRHEAIWFERDDGTAGYHGFDARNLERRFLASPLEFTKVISGFTENRQHPVLRDWRAHRGIDLPAPTGTPVRAIADGTIEFIGQQRGYGNVIVIRHDARTTTLYAHLHTFTHGLAPGAAVSRADVIGGVGQTGWATGPHLHFEFHLDGEPVDPMPVIAEATTAPRALLGAERVRFRALAREFHDRFRLLDTQLAARFE